MTAIKSLALAPLCQGNSFSKRAFECVKFTRSMRGRSGLVIPHLVMLPRRHHKHSISRTRFARAMAHGQLGKFHLATLFRTVLRHHCRAKDAMMVAISW